MNFGNNNFFEKKQSISVPVGTQIIFVSDMFIEDYVGGAELTSEALVKSSPFSVYKLHSRDVTLEILEKNYTKYWIFGNFASLDPNLIPSIVANIKYSVVEYDYKYCKYRSPQIHKHSEGKDCDCHNEMTGKIISAFYYGAKSLWWMSEKQRDHYLSLFPFLEEKENTVLSSVFDDEFFAKVHTLRELKKDRNEKYLVLGSNSLIKGYQQAVEYCTKNKLEYETAWNLPYDQLLEKMSESKGLVFLPLGWDTCPRLVIEAKLLGMDLIINDNVQHKDEEWFATNDLDLTESYLFMARSYFWNGIKNTINYVPEISGYTTVLNCIKQNYPFEASINSLLGFCDEVIVVDGGSTDGTYEKILEMSEKNSKIKVHQKIRDWESERFAVFDGEQKAYARSLCTKQFCWQQDIDEVVHEKDYLRIKEIAKSFPNSIVLLALPVIEYWGRKEKVRLDVTPWKWRLSKNIPEITHGIPAHLRKYDDKGQLYASEGTDGCDYIHAESGIVIPCANFYTQDVHNARMAALSGNMEAKNAYESWFKKIINHYPAVHHYSWFNIERKVRTYKNYWSKHWQSLYNIKQEDTVENNMFFDKKWSEVTDNDIKEISSRLENEMAGWIFHSKVDFRQKRPFMTDLCDHPKVISEWIEKEGEIE